MMKRLLLALLLVVAPAGRLADTDRDILECTTDTDCESREARP